MPNDEDNAIATLEHSNRVCAVVLYVTGLQLRRMVTVMREPFPLLTRLSIQVILGEGVPPIFPAEFLGGSAPCLQEITLSGIPYPTLPTLLLSTSDLITLTLQNIPETGYISPEAMCACLAVLPRLKSFAFEFLWATPHIQRRSPPITRTVLPSLKFFRFEGTTEYLEDLVSQMDSPQLKAINVVFSDHTVDSRFPQLSTFIERSVGPEPSRHAVVSFDSEEFRLTLYRHVNCPDWFRHSVSTTIYSSYFQVFELTQFLSPFSATLFTVTCLEFSGQVDDSRLEEMNDVEWLDFLCQFPALQMLYVGHEPTGFVTRILESIAGETVAEVLPSLDLICLEDQPASFVETFDFVAARRLSHRPVTVVETSMEFYKRLNSHIRK